MRRHSFAFRGHLARAWIDDLSGLENLWNRTKFNGEIVGESWVQGFRQLRGVGSNFRDHYAARFVMRAKPGVATLNELSRAHRRHEKPATELDLANQVDPAPGADDRLEAERKRQQIEQALAKLPERQRAALLLRSEQGLDYSEIAKALETTVSSVKSLIHRAREALLAELGGEAPR